MQTQLNWFVEQLRRYGLAICCIFAPVMLSLGVFSLAESVLIPATLFSENSDGTVNNGRIIFKYDAALPSDAVAESAVKAGAAVAVDAQKRIPPNESMYLPAINYAARNSFAIVSGFLFIASLTTLLFSGAVLYGHWPWKEWRIAAVIVSFLVWCVVATIITSGFSNPHGRYLVVHDLLDAADGFKGLEKFAITLWGAHLSTGLVADYFVHANTIISLVPVGMLLTALMAVSIRNPDNSTPERLKSRLMILRCAMLLGSSCFVIAVLSNKALVEWPLQLVLAAQAKALRPIADSLVLQFGAVGTAAIFAAFTPAVAAWMLDVAALGPAKRRGAAKLPAPPKDDGLIFAPMHTVAAIVAVLAPVLASPVVDSLKSLAGVIGT